MKWSAFCWESLKEIVMGNTREHRSASLTEPSMARKTVTELVT